MSKDRLASETVLALNDFYDQCRFALGFPAFDVFFHLYALSVHFLCILFSQRYCADVAV